MAVVRGDGGARCGRRRGDVAVLGRGARHLGLLEDISGDNGGSVGGGDDARNGIRLGFDRSRARRRTGLVVLSPSEVINETHILKRFAGGKVLERRSAVG